MWIRRDNAFKPIVSPAFFAKAKKILVELENGRTLSDKELLDKLKSLWRRKGHLSLKIMLAAKSVPNPTLYTRRFGSLTGAYKRIGFKPESRYNFTEHTAKIDGVVCSVAADIIAAIEKRGRGTTFLHELYLLTLSRNFTVSLTVAWHVANGKTEHGRWQLRKIRYTRSDLTLVIRLNTSNVDVQDYFLLPTTNLPPRCQRDRIAISNRIFAEFRHDDLDEVVKALDHKIGAGNIVRRTRTDRVVPN